MIPKTAEYALRAMVWLGRAPQEHHAAEALASAIQVPRRYLHKVLQDLGRAGLVRSQPGPGGGYAISRPAEQITILDVINAIGAIERIRKCPMGLKSHTSLCPLHRELDQAYASMEQAFSRVTLSQLLKSSDSVPPLCEVSR